jgi:hypothetical protein
MQFRGNGRYQLSPDPQLVATAHALFWTSRSQKHSSTETTIVARVAIIITSPISPDSIVGPLRYCL